MHVICLSHVYQIAINPLYKISEFCFWGKDQSCGGLSLAYKFVTALISPNLYPQKTKDQRGHIK